MITKIKKKYFFAISVPTKNREKFIENGILKQLNKLKELNIGLYIFDNSDNNLTEILVKKYLKTFDNLYYMKNTKSLTYGENTTQAFLIPDAEYLLVTGDGIIIKQERLKKIVETLRENKLTCLILNNRVTEIEDKLYMEPIEFCKELSWHCTLLGSAIFSAELIEVCKKNNIFNKYKYSDFMNLGVLLEGILFVKELKILFIKEFLLKGSNNKLKKLSHWKKQTLKIFGVDWINFINFLPQNYNVVKDEVILDHGMKSGLFSLKGFIILRCDGFFGVKDIKEYSNILKKITTLNKSTLYIIACIPRSFLNIIKQIYKIIKKLKKEQD